MKSGMLRQGVSLSEEKRMNMTWRRATDLKGISRVFFPRKARSLEVESSLQTLRDVLMTTLRQYVDKNCKERGDSMGNFEFCVGDPETCACAQFSVYPTQGIFAFF